MRFRAPTPADVLTVTLSVALWVALGITPTPHAARAAANPESESEPQPQPQAQAARQQTAADDLVSRAVHELEGLDLLALAVAERRAVVRHGDDLHLVSVGDPLPGADGTWLRQVRADRMTVQLPGGRTAHLYSDRPDEERVELVQPTAPSDSIPPSPPYLIPIRRPVTGHSDGPPDRPSDAPSSAGEGGIRP